MNQNHKISEEALESFITMFQTNLALTKLMWKVDSRRTWEVSKLITRNVEIGRRKAAGASIQDLLPAKLRKDADASGSHSQPVSSPYPAAGVPETAGSGPEMKADAESAELAQTPPTEASTARSPEEDEQAQVCPRNARIYFACVANGRRLPLQCPRHPPTFHLMLIEQKQVDTVSADRCKIMVACCGPSQR